MRLRPATPDDAAGIAAVEDAAAHHPWTRAAVEGSLGLSTTHALVLEEDGVAGHLLSSVVAGEAEVLILAVHPAHQRRGLARRLLARAAELWVAHGVTRGFLEVRADNAPAIALYRSTGWSQAGVRKRYYADGTDALALTWSPR